MSCEPPDQSLLEFYYNSFKNTTSGFIKSAALLGLKYDNNKKLNWNTLTETDSEYPELVDFAEKFDINKISLNPLPSTKEELTFTILHIEKNILKINDHNSINWIITMLISIPSFNFENSWLNEINSSISNILLNIDLEKLKDLLQNENILIKTMEFIDLLPGNFFNRLTGRFDELGVEFLFNLNSAVERKKITTNNSNSNILNYLCWNFIETF